MKNNDKKMKDWILSSVSLQSQFIIVNTFSRGAFEDRLANGCCCCYCYTPDPAKTTNKGSKLFYSCPRNKLQTNERIFL